TFLPVPSGSPLSAVSLGVTGPLACVLCDGLIWPKNSAEAALRRLGATVSWDFLPLTAMPSFLAEDKKALPLLSRSRTGLRRPSSPACRSPSRPQWSGPEHERME